MLCEAAVSSPESFSINTSQLAYLFEYNPSYNYYHEPSSPVAGGLLVIVRFVYSVGSLNICITQQWLSAWGRWASVSYCLVLIRQGNAQVPLETLGRSHLCFHSLSHQDILVHPEDEYRALGSRHFGNQLILNRSSSGKW